MAHEELKMPYRPQEGKKNELHIVVMLENIHNSHIMMLIYAI